MADYKRCRDCGGMGITTDDYPCEVCDGDGFVKVRECRCTDCAGTDDLKE